MATQLNFAQQMYAVLNELGGTRPRLLLHACCGPCSSAVLEQLCQYLEITVLYYNPNLTMDREDFSESDDLRGLKEGRITVQWIFQTSAVNFLAACIYFFVNYERQTGIKPLPCFDGLHKSARSHDRIMRPVSTMQCRVPSGHMGFLARR